MALTRKFRIPTAIRRKRRLEQASPVWRTYGPIAVVAMLGVILSLVAMVNVRQWERRDAENAFREASRDRVLVVQREIEHTLAVVRDVAGLFESYGRVSRREFRHFVGPALKRLAGIQFLAWVPRVSAEKLPEFLQNAQRSFPPFRILERNPNGRLVDAASRPFYLPVLYVQPYRLNREELGLDLGAIPDLRERFEHASSALTVFVGDEATKSELPPPLIAYLPVFRNTQPADADSEGDEEPADNLTSPPRDPLGYAVGRFRIGEIVERALKNLSPGGVDLRFFSTNSSGGKQLLYTHYSQATSAPEPAGMVYSAGDRLHPALTFSLVAANLRWEVACFSTSSRFEADAWMAWLVLLGGLAFTALLTAYLVTLVGRSEQVRRLVGERTRQLANAVSALKRQVANRKRAEANLHQLNETLELRVARRTRESKRRADELEQFAYVASHDLKAPLRAIANLASWLQEDLRGKLDDETRNQLELMQDRVRRMQNLIDGLLEYSRVGRVRGDQRQVDTGKLLVEIADSLSPPPGFSIRVDRNMPSFRTDRLHLGQVFANLISNALKHHGGTTGNIHVGCRDLGDAYEFSVSDDGRGIEPKYHDKVFLMFQTLQTRDKASDTGIGLALVQKIVQEHGGSITLDSEIGEGARFRFRWPKED